MSRLALFLCVILGMVACSCAFSPSALPMGTRCRAVAASGPTMLLTADQGVSIMALVADEPLTVMAGRGDRRSKRGKRFMKSFGKSRARKGAVDEKTRTPAGGVVGQP
eukprot:CAMPEP_0173392276 /NCGR_PEP_ID=MMETSP1356-20130122/18917_1 /TAXON_ID=77927 ORGANISM="Hemiselmis virescens, Strain PCC157" /NCGR_SAMPLE_ID=MMETSP1356 /ASSEMBLY_ACC=CAM_ASM_000847 /LENGTH=107 /DNA_ID=CAMNT_0014350025 /DNA_START=21 /DNA_END=344 /DNA_ORIENTATION=+